MPFPVQVMLVSLIGICLGSAINWAIYRFAWNKRTISPWGPRPAEAQPRSLLDRIPIIGWIFLKREEKIHGRAFFARPMAIELLFGVALAIFYFWMHEGGLTGLRKNAVEVSGYLTWFLFLSTLFLLLTIATFIDFDEKTIPDQITIPGTLFALAYCTIWPQARLPIQDQKLLERLHLWSPQEIPDWVTGSSSLAILLGCFAFWCIGFVIGGMPIRFGKFGTIKYFWPLLLQPKRKTSVDIPMRERKPHWTVVLMPIIFLAGSAGIVATFFLGGPDNWLGLACAIMGMVFGMILVWGIRLVAGQALGKEAMGFGDVTLMAMIGAFLGWQPALLTFAFAPFAAVLIAIAQFVFSRKPDIAFGPYLSLGALFVVLGWSSLWNDWASRQVFILGEILLIIIAASLAMMWLMLAGWGKLKDATG